MYPQGYGYAAYPYSPATSPAPQVGGDGQLYGAQQYQYPAFFPAGSFASSVATPTQGDLAANKAGGLKPAESKNVASAAGMTKGSNGQAAGKPNNQTAFNTSSNLYGSGAPAGGYAAGYQDARFNYDGYYGTGYSDVQRPVASSYSKANSVTSSRNQNYRSNSNYTVWYLSLIYCLFYSRKNWPSINVLCAGCAPACINDKLRYSWILQQDVSKQVIW